MSGAEQVESFNPLLIIIWLTQLVLLAIDWSQDNQIKWSIPIIGSFFIIQVYMIWKTNYDDMMDEERDRQAKALGGPVDTPMIDPSSTKLGELYKSSGKKGNKTASKPNMVNLNTKASDTVEKE